MARPITAGELALLRKEGNFSFFKLAMDYPNTVFQARVNKVFTTSELESVVSVPYDGGSGSYEDVVPGMTLWVGTTIGARDLGECRVRKDPTSSIMYIGESSEIAWADDSYITVIDDFNFWAKHPIVDKTDITDVDYDIGYTANQNLYFAPVPVLGPSIIIELPDGGSITPTAANSWMPDGGSITTYLWEAPGSDYITDEDTVSPTIHYTQAGRYNVYCTISAYSGNTSMGVRRVYVFDDNNPPETHFTVDPISGAFDSGGWSFSITMKFDANQSNIRDRVRCVLFADDYFDGEKQSLGYLAGYEKTICEGWISGESIESNFDLGQVRFTVQGPQFWIAKIPGFPAGLKWTNLIPETWTYIYEMTVDKSIQHFAHWRSTISAIIDIFRTGDTQILPATTCPPGDLWGQFSSLANMIVAKAISNRYGQIYFNIDSQYLDTSDRTSIPVVMDITENDRIGSLTGDRIVLNKINSVEISGIKWDGVAVTTLIAKAPGKLFSRFGSAMQKPNMLLSSQEKANTLAGLIYGRENNEYPAINIELGENNRFIDIVPNQYVTVTLDGDTNPRGIAWNAKKLIPRRITLIPDMDSGGISVKLVCEMETFKVHAQTVIPPIITKVNVVNGGSGGTERPPWTPPSFIPKPRIQPPVVVVPPVILVENCLDGPTNGPWKVALGGTYYNEMASAYASMPCIIRAGNATNKSSYAIWGDWKKRSTTSEAFELTTDDDFYSIYGIDDAGQRVATGVHDAVVDPHWRTGTFAPGAATEIRAIELVVGSSSLEEVYTELGWMSMGYLAWGTLLSEHKFFSLNSSGLYIRYDAEMTGGVAGNAVSCGANLTWPNGSGWVLSRKTQLWTPSIYALHTYYQWDGLFTQEGVVDWVSGTPVVQSQNILGDRPGNRRCNTRAEWYLNEISHYTIVHEVWLGKESLYSIRIGNMCLYNICPPSWYNGTGPIPL